MAADSAQARLFFALVPDDGLRRELAELALVVADRVHGRAIPAGHIHLTLVFLGNVPRARLDIAQEAAHPIPSPPFDLRFQTLGRFRRSDVTWIAPLGAAKEADDLARALAERLTDRGFLLERREFHPHVTLARRSARPPPKLEFTPFDWHSGSRRRALRGDRRVAVDYLTRVAIGRARSATHSLHEPG